MCDCKNRNDVCFKCLDDALDESNQNIINGTVGKNFIDSLIELKTNFINIIPDKNSELVKKTQNEILALRECRKIHHND